MSLYALLDNYSSQRDLEIIKEKILTEKGIMNTVWLFGWCIDTSPILVVLK
mgnify:CR=1 FL=1